MSYDPEFELEVTENLAPVFAFEVVVGSTGNRFVRCIHCGKRYEFRHYGRISLNDRMIRHAYVRHGIGQKEPGL